MAVSPPSKRELASWWKKFRKNNDKSDEKGEQAHTVIDIDVVDFLLGVYQNVAQQRAGTAAGRTHKSR
jgi:hypothetical protein